MMHSNRKTAEEEFLVPDGKTGYLGDRLDQIGIAAGFLMPIGLVVGNIGFEALIGVGGGCWLLRLLLTGSRQPLQVLKHPIVAAWIAWYGCILASLIVNGPGDKGFAHDIVFFRYLLFTVSLLDISGRRPVVRYLLYGLAAGVIFAAVNTVCAYWIGFDLLGKPLIRYTGKLKEASRIAGMAAYVVPVFLTWGLLGSGLSGKMKGGAVAVGGIAFVQLLQTHVRTAIVGSLAGALFSAAFVLRRRVSTRVAAGLVLVLIASAWLFFHYGQMFTLATFYDRIYYWKVSFAIWQDHPIFGVGISSFQNAYREMAASGRIGAFVGLDGVVYQLPEQTHAHNLLFMLISCNGLAGLAAFVWVFSAAVKSIFQDAGRNAGGFRAILIAWPVVFLLIGITGFNIYHSWYQALFAFFMVLIGSGRGEDGCDERYRQ